MTGYLSNYSWLGIWTARYRRLSSGLDWFALAAVGLPLLIYSQTLAPTIYNLDSAELTTAAATNGIVRATGYPLYLVLGKIWSWGSGRKTLCPGLEVRIQTLRLRCESSS